MKKLFCIFLLILILISCKNSNPIKEIETLTYFTNAKDFQIFSTTNKNGVTQVIFKSENSKEYSANYQFKINKGLLDSLISISKNANSGSFKFKVPEKIWYCGYWHIVQITYENGEKIKFKYPFVNKDNKQFVPFESIIKQIKIDSLHATRLSVGKLDALYIKQEVLSKKTFKEDSIEIIKIIEKYK